MEKNVTLNAILAIDTKYGIGKNGGLPWPRNNEDMKWFREKTIGHSVIMGRKTWESIGSKKLEGRENIVLSSSKINGADIWANEIDFGNLKEKIGTYWLIGGASLFNNCMRFCDKVYLTKFKKSYDCDTFIDKDILKPFSHLCESRNTTDCSFSVWARDKE
jgi:dihydrofolate reductase